MDTRKINIEDCGNVANVREDMEFLKIVVERSDTHLRKMEVLDIFPYLKRETQNRKMKIYPCNRNPKEPEVLSVLKGVLVVLTIALMNVEDLKGEETTELLPFLQAVRDKCHHDVTYGMCSVLMLSVTNGVSNETGKLKKCERGSVTHYCFVRLYEMGTGWTGKSGYRKSSEDQGCIWKLVFEEKKTKGSRSCEASRQCAFK